MYPVTFTESPACEVEVKTQTDVLATIKRRYPGAQFNNGQLMPAEIWLPGQKYRFWKGWLSGFPAVEACGFVEVVK
jgi:hypothetical protein